MEKEVITQKAHKCGYCEKEINKGDKATYLTGRAARLDKDGVQIGIQYYRVYLHIPMCC